jgi:hypothetical protein
LWLLSTYAPSDRERPGAIEVRFHDAEPGASLILRPQEPERFNSLLLTTADANLGDEPPRELQVEAPALDSSAVWRGQVASALALASAVDGLLTPVDSSSASFGGSLGAGSDGSAGSSQAGPAGGAGASFFGASAYGVRFVYVLDMSGSMSEGGRRSREGNRFRRAAEELIHSIDRLHADQFFYVFLFSHLTRPLFDEPPPSAHWRPATPENKLLLRAWLSNIQPEGDTDPSAALLLGLQLRPDAVFLLSDGEFHGKEKPVLAAMNRAERRRRPDALPEPLRIPIHTVAFENRVAGRALEELASQTGGSHRFIPPPAGRRSE